MGSIDNSILTSLKKRGRGVVFTKDDYAHYSNPKRVQKALEQLVNQGLVVRVARGIYCYPKKDKVWGTGYLPPSYDDIANAIAKKERAKIVPTGVHALNRLGLSEQLPMRFVYLTSGRTRSIELADGHTMQFVHTQKAHVLELLQKEDKHGIQHDLALMPDWVQTIVMEAIDNR